MLHLHRHHARHAARKPAPAREAPQAIPLPERFLPLLEHAEKVARGLWVNPEHEDWIAALRREFRQWEREQRGE